MSWYLLIHQLPPKPLYLRAQVRNRLAKVGAVALKNSVYVLPCGDDCLEDMQWIAQEAAAGGGEAFVCKAEFVAGVAEQALVRQFQDAAAAAYATLKRDVGEALRGVRSRKGDGGAELLRFRKRLAEIAEVDFFGARARKEVETMLRAFETRIQGRRTRGPEQRGAHAELVGHTWVTRHGPKVDRLASAWLVRRFLDPKARFRFIDAEHESPRKGEIGFDMPGGQFSHDGERCTLETLVAQLGIRDAGVRAIAEIVHDLDLKDGRFARPETEGVRRLLLGLVRAHPGDEQRLDRGLRFFDELYASFAGGAAAKPASGHRRPE